MGSLPFIISTTKPPEKVYSFATNISRSCSSNFGKETRFSRPKYSRGDHFLCLLAQEHHSNPLIDGEEDDPEDYVQALRVPDDWLNPSKAMEEAEWLKATLHKWLDDEYCPEETNVEISKVAAHSYYESLMEKETDLGEILLKMATSLGSISFQESFHGAFSSANAAEAEWLKATLHKWLDDEYCPEETNVEISKVVAHSYYESLMEKETDLGEILLKMATSLGSISFQESFHGAFSSANAAVNLIIQRIEL